MSLPTLAVVRKWFTPQERQETVTLGPMPSMDELVEQMGREVGQTLEKSAFNTIRAGYQKVQERKRVEVFAVFEADNGYFATTRGGAIVVGETLSAVCDAAQAKVAEEKLIGQEANAKVAMYGSVVIRGLSTVPYTGNTLCINSTRKGSINGQVPITLTRGERVDGQTDAQRKQGAYLFAQVHRSSV